MWKLFAGSAEIIARTRIVGVNEIAPGTEGLHQLAVSEPVAVARGDRFIVRRPSPAATLGWRCRARSYPGRRHRRFRPETLTHLQTLSAGTPQELLFADAGPAGTDNRVHTPATERHGLESAAGRWLS